MGMYIYTHRCNYYIKQVGISVSVIIKKQDFIGISRVIKPDTRRRVVLPSKLVKEGIVYHMYVNSDGQIILDPQVTIPASESWLFENKDILELVQQGLADSAEDRVSEIDLGTL
jgi:hypothetical protein